MQFYETPTPNDEEKPSEPIPAETEAQVPKDRAAAKKAISGGFCLTVFQTLVCVLILLAAFFLRGFVLVNPLQHASCHFLISLHK